MFLLGLQKLAQNEHYDYLLQILVMLYLFFRTFTLRNEVSWDTQIQMQAKCKPHQNLTYIRSNYVTTTCFLPDLHVASIDPPPT